MNKEQPIKGETFGEWQLCPKCCGQGTVSKPPYLPGDVEHWVSSTPQHECDVCNGKKIIAKPTPIAEGEERWISVEDRLPDEGNRVLICSKGYGNNLVREIATYTNGGKIEFDDENDDWPECYNESLDVFLLPKGFWVNSEDEEKFFGRYKVTHWQPLPKPPSLLNSKQSI